MNSPRILRIAAAVALGSILGSAHAQRDDGPRVWQDDAGRVVVEGDKTYDSWGDYFRSPVFRAFGMRCGTPSPSRDDGAGGEEPGQQSLLGSPADCGNSTNPAGEYEPSVGTLYRIPVVVHVIRNNAGTQGDISAACVQNQIDILNEDFRAILGSNGEEGYDVRVEFFLAETDPSGSATNGITYSNNDTWFNDGGSYWNSLAWDPTRYINIYTNTAGGALGYVPYLPHEGSPGSLSDRVVCLWSAFGNCDTAEAPFNLGRTLTHEVGHYFGLLHTFDGGCGTSSCNSTGDTICDTNPQQSPNYGCPGSASSCSTPDPLANYMNYTDDGCMNQFTQQQARRIRCTIMHYRSLLPCAACDGTADADGDGVPNASDNCPSTANPDQADSDGDGTGDACDGCPSDPNKSSPGACGCGVADTDSDGDGVVDCNDVCPNDPYVASGSTACGCGSLDVDWNSDGALDCNGVVFDVGTFTLSGGQAATVSLPGYTGTMTGFAVAIDYTGGGVSWASDMVAGFFNGTSGIQAGGFNSSFGYPSAGAWSYDGSGSAADGVYIDGMPGSLSLPASGPLQFRIKNGWSASAAVTYANVRVVIFGVTPTNPCGSLSATADTTSFGFSGTSSPVAVSVGAGAGCAWTASSNAAWLVLSGGSGSGDGSATFTVELNGSASARSATIAVSNGVASDVTISIEQEGNACAVDSDGDGVGDCDDGCPNDPNKTSPGACGCGVADTDSDGDGTPNCNDACPSDPNKIAPGVCGCGVADTDSDGDGVADCNDECPSDPNKTSAGACGCGVADTDTETAHARLRRRLPERSEQDFAGRLRLRHARHRTAVVVSGCRWRRLRRCGFLGHARLRAAERPCRRQHRLRRLESVGVSRCRGDLRRWDRQRLRWSLGGDLRGHVPVPRLGRGFARSRARRRVVRGDRRLRVVRLCDRRGRERLRHDDRERRRHCLRPRRLRGRIMAAIAEQPGHGGGGHVRRDRRRARREQHDDARSGVRRRDDRRAGCRCRLVQQLAAESAGAERSGDRVHVDRSLRDDAGRVFGDARDHRLDQLQELSGRPGAAGHRDGLVHLHRSSVSGGRRWQRRHQRRRPRPAAARLGQQRREKRSQWRRDRERC
jgi:hypothetical protein